MTHRILFVISVIVLNQLHRIDGRLDLSWPAWILLAFLPTFAVIILYETKPGR